MKNILYLYFFVSLFTACVSSDDAEDSQAPSKPNVVFIISDDQGWGDYSFMGHPSIETPHIDKLANESLTYTRGYVTAPLCSPSLASMLTGLFPHQHGITGNDPTFTPQTKKYSDDWMVERRVHFDTLIEAYKQKPLLTDLLAEEGYVSFQAGKWWLGSYADGGFDEGMTHGIPEQGGRHGDDGLAIGREGMDTLFRFMDKAVEQQKPFFTWYAPFLPHSPHTPPDSLLQKYQAKTDSEALARYWANCEWFDLTVGQLMGYLKDNGLDEQTIVFYVCDNGWLQNPDKKNRYQKGSKRSPYDMGIRTPIMVRWEGQVEPVFDTTNLASSADLVPTVLELVGKEPPESMPGLNLTNWDMVTAREAVFSEAFAHDIESLQEPTLSLYERIIITNQWKLIVPSTRNMPDSTKKLYRIKTDPSEQENLLAEHPEIAEKLEDRLDAWWKPEFE